MRTSIRGAFLLLVTALLALGTGVLPAGAHSRLISISPKDGAKLPESPSEIVLTFNEDVNPQFVTVRVTDSEGGDVVGAKATAAGPKVTLPVAAPIAAGTYKVLYRVVSADSHPISGSSTFTIEGNPQSPPPTASPTASPTDSTTVAATPTATSTPTPQATATTSTDDASDEESDSTPIWVWVLVFAGLLAAIGATFYAVKRDNSQS